MTQYIDKSALVAEIERIMNEQQEICKADVALGKNPDSKNIEVIYQFQQLIKILDTLEVKYDSLEKFKSLQHISGDLHQTLQDWGYVPNLYYFDGSWHVDWISCEEGNSIKGFTEDTVEEAIDKAYNWFHSTFCNS